MQIKDIVVFIDGVQYQLVAVERPTTRTSLGSLYDLDYISKRTQTALEQDGIEYLEQALDKSEADLLRVPSFGRKALNEIREAVHKFWPQFRIGQFKQE